MTAVLRERAGAEGNSVVQELTPSHYLLMLSRLTLRKNPK